MVEVYAKLFDLLDARSRKRFVLLAGIMVAVSLSELIGISSVLLLLGVLADPGRMDQVAALAWARTALGLDDPFAFQTVLAGATIAVVALGLVVKAGGIYAIVRYSQSCGAAISIRLLDAYLRFPYDWFLGRNTADIANNVLNETGRMVGQVLEPALRLLGSVLLALVLVGFLLTVDPVVALAAAATVGGLYAAIFVLLRSHLTRLGQETVAANRARYRIASEAAGGLKELKLLGLENSYGQRFAVPARQLARVQATSKAMSELPRYALEAVAFTAMIGMVLALMLRNDGDLASAIPVIGTFAFAALRLLPVLQQIYHTFAQIRGGRPALDALHADYRDATARLAQQPAPAPASARLPLHDTLELDDLRYSYPAADRPALRGVSLTLPARSTIGLVGGTGAGKTTLVDLMLGLLRPDAGAIRVDGRTLDRDTLRAWQQNIGYVPQVIYLTDATVAENIAFGLPRDRIDMAAVERAARIAALHDFVMSELPQGYDTFVGERGVRLSGGQRQRIGIARALYHDPALLIFDEATSALDTLTEKLVMDAVQRIRQDKTVVMIAHRLSTVRSCDCIYLLENGVVSAQGRFDDLVASSDTFRRMAAAG
jgi:ABC-type multidrug transport system fused ATPase/permease subunit